MVWSKGRALVLRSTRDWNERSRGGGGCPRVPPAEQPVHREGEGERRGVRLQPPPAELHYARQFRHFAKTKTRGRRKRRTKRKRRRERRTERCELGRGRVFGTPPPLFSSEPLIPKAAETPACLQLR